MPVLAAPQQGKFGGGRPHFEARQRAMAEFRANREAKKFAKQQNQIQTQTEEMRAAPPPPSLASSPSLSSAVQQNQGNIERDNNPNKMNRLTPEERMALRKQIREARREIYLQRTQ